MVSTPETPADTCRLAIPLMGTRVAPRFDCARAFLLVTLSKGTATEREQATAVDWPPHSRAKQLCDRGVTTVVCGGIDAMLLAQLRALGLVVYPWVTGDAEDALTCWLNGQMQLGAMVGQGGRCHGRWRFCMHAQ